MDRTFAQDQVRHKRNAFILTCAGAYLLNSDAINLLPGATAVLQNQGVWFNPLPGDVAKGDLVVSTETIIESRTNKRSDFDADLLTPVEPDNG